ncbi:TetR/AcrR family transcriptional regulator [Neptunicoccus cionae]|uniref:TetR family transcriptional regulator n=1 Tax=Neptunicoccus cionae TaxID=2035344 RepID=A0A916R272_9RHOB|nr:TetR/AcrR family transcriptional regulator [Amylibacter cionae]GGA28328.1 TetR family transcriptional regulator [Amylibacter cionae]
MDETKRKRAPSKRSLETRKRIFDSAEHLFAERGFDGASIRDIAKAAAVQTALVNHHGGAKADFFAAIIARRADPLAERRIGELTRLRPLLPDLSPHDAVLAILHGFIDPFLELARDDEGWRNYARLVAQVSSDQRWAPLAAQYFDPTAQQFLAALIQRFPTAPPAAVAQGFVFTISAVLGLVTSRWRITALANDAPTAQDAELADGLFDYAGAGFIALLAQD